MEDILTIENKHLQIWQKTKKKKAIIQNIVN